MYYTHWFVFVTSCYELCFFHKNCVFLFHVDRALFRMDKPRHISRLLSLRSLLQAKILCDLSGLNTGNYKGFVWQTSRRESCPPYTRLDVQSRTQGASRALPHICLLGQPPPFRGLLSKGPFRGTFSEVLLLEEGSSRHLFSTLTQTSILSPFTSPWAGRGSPPLPFTLMDLN